MYLVAHPLGERYPHRPRAMALAGPLAESVRWQSSLQVFSK